MRGKCYFIDGQRRMEVLNCRYVAFPPSLLPSLQGNPCLTFLTHPSISPNLAPSLPPSFTLSLDRVWAPRAHHVPLPSKPRGLYHRRRPHPLHQVRTPSFPPSLPPSFPHLITIRLAFLSYPPSLPPSLPPFLPACCSTSPSMALSRRSPRTTGKTPPSPPPSLPPFMELTLSLTSSLPPSLPSPLWMTAVDMLDDDTFLGAEDHYNLFTVRRACPPSLPPSLPPSFL